MNKYHKRSLFVLLLAASLVSRAGADEGKLLSALIEEADGTSGQNTKAGSGIKTGHIQNGAVTGAKIADEAVTYRAIAPNSVANSKIIDGAVTDAKLGFGAVTTPKIADGAVTDAKITGIISGAKIGRHGHDASDIVVGTIDSARLNIGTGPGTVAAGDHNHDAVYQKKSANIIVVAPNNGDFASPIAAIDSISDASADKPYLVKIMPGVYDLGSATLKMKEYVDIEGSGELITKITGNAIEFGIVAGASRAELRNLTVEATGSEGTLVGIYNSNASPRISNVTINTAGGKNTYAVYNVLSSPVLVNTTVTATGGDTTFGVFGIHSSPLIRNSQVSASNGIYSYYSGTATIEGSSVTGSLVTLFNDTGATTLVANSRLNIGKVANNGIIKCVGVYDGSFEPVTCR